MLLQRHEGSKPPNIRAEAEEKETCRCKKPQPLHGEHFLVFLIGFFLSLDFYVEVFVGS